MVPANGQTKQCSYLLGLHSVPDFWSQTGTFWHPKDNVRDSETEHPKPGLSQKKRDGWSACIYQCMATTIRLIPQWLTRNDHQKWLHQINKLYITARKYAWSQAGLINNQQNWKPTSTRVRFNRQTEIGKISVVSGTSRLVNHKVPSVAISGHNTGNSAEQHKKWVKKLVTQSITSFQYNSRHIRLHFLSKHLTYTLHVLLSIR